MSDTGLSLLWLAGQVTAVAAAGLLLAAWAGRRGPGAAAPVTAAALAAAVALAPLAVVPLPTWWAWPLPADPPPPAPVAPPAAEAPAAPAAAGGAGTVPRPAWPRLRRPDARPPMP